MRLENPNNRTHGTSAEALASRGLELMARHRNLVHAVAERQVDVDELIGWSRGLTDEEWDLMAAAENYAARFMTRYQRQALCKAYDDAPMAGRAR